mgnify:FL=1
MPIMSDKWIRQKAENEQLIVPFHAESRSSNEDGTPVTSYGLSSFGYDIRLGNIFRFFNRSNPNNLNVEVRSVRDSIGPDVIDPINFNEALTSCHELRDDECITIPPHGFMLGVSKERIKLSNEFTAICMEKSTLARCFTGDTKIALADGTSPTFLEAIERIKNGERLFGYSVNEEANITIAELIEPRKIGREEILEVVLDNGEIIRCTADHKFLTLDCDYVEAKDLVEGQSLYPLYRTVSRGYEAVYQPMDPYIVRRMSKAKEALNIEIGENHKVVTVRKASPGWEGEQDVYCLTAPEYGNFALESGVFVHNCGLCVTVTPLEAGWEGYVTLELSNKTDLPIKLTPGMGICQVLFIHGNEPCEISYADRNGKYQDQPAEPVLPRRKM